MDRLKFNCITLHEPSKAEYSAFRNSGPRPDRRAFSIIIQGKESPQVSECVVNLTTRHVESWKDLSNVMPTLTLEDLDVTEQIAREDPRVIQACREIGITDMSMVYFDA